MEDTFDFEQFEDAQVEVPVSEEATFNFEQFEDDPDGFVPEKQSTINTSTAALAGAQQGLTFGLSDEISGAIGAGLEGSSVSPVPGESKLDQLKRLYSEYRDIERSRLQAAESQQPEAFTAGDVSGGFLTPGGIFKALGKAGIKGVAKTGAAMGGAEALGRTEADILSAEGLTDVGIGTGVGGLFGKVAGKVASRFDKTNMLDKSKELAQEANLDALQSIGAQKTDFLKEFGAKTSKRSGVEQAKGTGQTLLDEGLIKLRQDPIQLNTELNKTLDSVFDDRIIPITKQLDDKLKTVGPDVFQEETLNLSAKMLAHVQELEELNKLNPSGSSSLVENARDSAQEVISRLANSQSPDKMSEALNAKRTLSQILNESDWSKSEVSGAKDYLKKMVSELREYSEKLANKVDPSLAEQLKKENLTYGRLSDAKQIAIKDLAKESAASGLSIGDYLTGGLGSAVGGFGGGLAAIGAKKGVEKFTGKTIPEVYNTFQALRKNKAAQSLADRAKNYSKKDQFISESGDSVSQAAITSTAAMTDTTDVSKPYQKDRMATNYIKKLTPEQIQQEVTNVRQQYGENGEKLASLLEKVSQKDSTGRAALMFSILQDPANRKMLGLMDEEE